MKVTLVVLFISILLLVGIIYHCIRFPSKSRTATRIRGIFIITLIIIMVISGLIEFAPRGKNSLFSEAGEGENKGSDTRETYSDGRDQDGTSDGFSIIISSSKVTVDDKEFDINPHVEESFFEFLKKRGVNGREIRLVDNYALSEPYRRIKEFLNDEGGVIIEESQ